MHQTRLSQDQTNWPRRRRVDKRATFFTIAKHETLMANRSNLRLENLIGSVCLRARSSDEDQTRGQPIMARARKPNSEAGYTCAVEPTVKNVKCLQVGRSPYKSLEPVHDLFTAAPDRKRVSHKANDAGNNGLFPRRSTQWMAIFLPGPAGSGHCRQPPALQTACGTRTTARFVPWPLSGTAQNAAVKRL